MGVSATKLLQEVADCICLIHELCPAFTCKSIPGQAIQITWGYVAAGGEAQTAFKNIYVYMFSPHNR